MQAFIKDYNDDPNAYSGRALIVVQTTQLIEKELVDYKLFENSHINQAIRDIKKQIAEFLQLHAITVKETKLKFKSYLCQNITTYTSSQSLNMVPLNLIFETFRFHYLKRRKKPKKKKI